MVGLGYSFIHSFRQLCCSNVVFCNNSVWNPVLYLFLLPTVEMSIQNEQSKFVLDFIFA